ncbi:MAG: GyrI-like domain-containing protein [Candidatus Heimdallarchaeota archaeon]|nr:GyrI-like domain-containing protein [Candidatus Heimdallarchaeota archaeon]MCK5143813.1 GyrI-like domain-containing protein [Candidatus Heimdallarchaeota archaeon]
MEKIDFKKKFKELYKPPGEPVIIEIPEFQYLMIDGAGYPGTSQEYQDAMSALYPVAYTLKFKLKKAGIIDYVVMPLEGLWWADDMEIFLVDSRKEEWLWTSMIMQPFEVTKEHYFEAIKEVEKKKNPVALNKMRLESHNEETSVQIMHIGSYSEEGPVIERMHQFALDKGYKLKGKHHEIYLSDPRRTPEEKWKTVLRQPICK